MHKIKMLLTAVIVISTSLLSGCTNNQDDKTISDNSEQVENQLPAATCSANPRNGEEPLTVYFTGLGSDTDGDIISYYWSFGDGETSSSKNPSHTYQNSGTYTARLTVTDDDGGTNTDSVTINVEEKSKNMDIKTLKHMAQYVSSWDGISVIGVVENVGDVDAKAEITVNFYNQYDYLVYSKEGITNPSYIIVGKKAFFNIFAGKIEYSYYTVEVNPTEDSQPTYSDYTFYIQSAEVWHHPYGTPEYSYNINGTIYNEGSCTAEYVNINCVLYDKWGNIIGWGDGHIGSQGENDFFPPETSKPFTTWTYSYHLSTGNFSDISNYELFASTPYGDYRFS